MSATEPAATPATPATDVVNAEQELCRALDPNGEPCIKSRAHPYSDTGGPKRAHRNAQNVAFHGGIKTPARFYLGAEDTTNISEADRQTWMRL